MKTLVIGSGILAAVAWLFPGLVVVGLFLGVLPGLVLMAMPTLFLYLLAIWLIRMALPIPGDALAYGIAAAVAVALAALAALPFRIAAEREFAAAAVPEVVPDRPIVLSGDVLIDEESALESPEPPVCDALCMAILDSEGVTSLTHVRNGRSVTYALVDAEEGAPEGLYPFEPAQILQLSERAIDRRISEALEADWQARLTGPQRLVTIPRPAGDPDWQLRTRLEGASEIIGPDGAARLRAVRLKRTVPGIPPYLAFRAQAAATGFADRRFVIGGPLRVTRSAFDEVLPSRLLARALALRDYAAAFGAAAR
jgi:hypothetical protein